MLIYTTPKIKKFVSGAYNVDLKNNDLLNTENFTKFISENYIDDKIESPVKNIINPKLQKSFILNEEKPIKENIKNLCTSFFTEYISKLYKYFFKFLIDKKYLFKEYFKDYTPEDFENCINSIFNKFGLINYFYINDKESYILKGNGYTIVLNKKYHNIRKSENSIDNLIVYKIYQLETNIICYFDDFVTEMEVLIPFYAIDFQNSFFNSNIIKKSLVRRIIDILINNHLMSSENYKINYDNKNDKISKNNGIEIVFDNEEDSFSKFYLSDNISNSFIFENIIDFIFKYILEDVYMLAELNNYINGIKKEYRETLPEAYTNYFKTFTFNEYCMRIDISIINLNKIYVNLKLNGTSYYFKAHVNKFELDIDENILEYYNNEEKYILITNIIKNDLDEYFGI